MTELTFHLGDPGLTLLHRAGLAGLWMTLKQLEQELSLDQRPGSLNWELTPREIKLSWQGKDLEVIDWLLRESFQLNDGLISLRGLDSKSMRKDSQVIVHQGILGTFLQHGKTRKASGDQTQALEFDDNTPPIIVRYKALESYAHQGFTKDLCDKKGDLLKNSINIAGWLNPGAAVRHTAFTSDTGFEESPQLAFALLYAPVACYYYILRSRLRDKLAQYALVIPEITNMETYARYRQDLHRRHASYQDFHATSLGDAGLRFLTYQYVADAAQTFQISRCQVLTLGTVAWSSQQKSRTDLFTVEATYKSCKNYRLTCDHFPPKNVINKEGDTYVATSFAREMIAENLARDHPWYKGLGSWINNNERFKQLSYERGGLYQMVIRTDMDPRERWFVEACHEAIYYTYGQIRQNTKPGDDVKARFNRMNVRLRSELSRCRKHDSFRETIISFWSKSGRPPTLKEHWNELIELVMDEKQWRKARDLALLALASYKGKEREGDPDEADSELEDEDLIGIPDLD